MWWQQATHTLVEVFTTWTGLTEEKWNIPKQRTGVQLALDYSFLYPCSNRIRPKLAIVPPYICTMLNDSRCTVPWTFFQLFFWVGGGYRIFQLEKHSESTDLGQVAHFPQTVTYTLNVVFKYLNGYSYNICQMQLYFFYIRDYFFLFTPTVNSLFCPQNWAENNCESESDVKSNIEDEEALVPKLRATAPLWVHFGFRPNDKGEPRNAIKAICKICCSKKGPVKSTTATNLKRRLQTY